MGMSLSKLWEVVKDREVWRAAVHGISESDVTEQLNNRILSESKRFPPRGRGKWGEHHSLVSPFL